MEGKKIEVVSFFSCEEKNYVSLHMEEAYTEMIRKREKNYSNNVLSNNLFSSEEGITLTSETFTRLTNYFRENQLGEEKEVIIDCDGIQKISEKNFNNLTDLTNLIRNVKFVNCNSTLASGVRESALLCDDEESYIKKFEHYAITKVESDYCDKNANYSTKTGAILDCYIDAKKIIEDNKEMFKWCYVLAYNIMKTPKFIEYGIDSDVSSEKPIILCHTLNGANIASVLAMLLECDIGFIDHLGPYNGLKMVNFGKEINQCRNYIIAVDVICLGNEIVRAKNIIDYLGGNTVGYASLINLDLAEIVGDKTNCSVLKISLDDAKNKLNYVVKTKLCPCDCDKRSDEK